MSLMNAPGSAPARSAGPPPRTGGNFSAWSNRHRKWIFAAPAMIFVGVLIVFPLAWTLYLSLTNSQGSVRAATEFIGLQNYLTVLTDTERFWPAVGRTLSFTGNVMDREGGRWKADIRADDRRLRGPMYFSVDDRGNVNTVTIDASDGRDRMRLTWDRR